MSDIPLILCADIGGTNTRLALFDGQKMRSDSAASYKNDGVAQVEDHLVAYLSETNVRPDAVSLALAGPVEGHKGKLANRDWHIDTASVSSACRGAKALLLNDMQAQGYAVPRLSPAAVRSYHPGSPSAPDAPRLVIGIGTGMNISPVFMLPNGDVFVPPSEAGHMRFAPHSDALKAFDHWLSGTFGAVEAEHVLSGRGIRLAYEYVTGGETIPSERVIKAAQDRDPHAIKALRLVVQALASFAGDIALIQMPAGGIFLIGGAARALEPFFKELGFDEAFIGEGRYAHMIASTPVNVVHDDFAALSGAARFAEQKLR